MHCYNMFPATIYRILWKKARGERRKVINKVRFLGEHLNKTVQNLVPITNCSRDETMSDDGYNKEEL